MYGHYDLPDSTLEASHQVGMATVGTRHNFRESFFQPDFYYGYRNGRLSGHTADRIEADTPDYLAVIRKGHNIPEFLFDYTFSFSKNQYK